ncbi:hypothetical protein CEXT_787621 [Caerostris extrusa]|uniref:Uncharacterized protein n=1 Tax=Caerostris extrusa TaxID=172846 RepID=A0AAV4NTD1_CAEEX|nr:hypothetical protein CEXT_787621 [Caerostris extrusa]
MCHAEGFPPPFLAQHDSQKSRSVMERETIVLLSDSRSRGTGFCTILFEGPFECLTVVLKGRAFIISHRYLERDLSINHEFYCLEKSLSKDRYKKGEKNPAEPSAEGHLKTITSGSQFENPPPQKAREAALDAWFPPPFWPTRQREVSFGDGSCGHCYAIRFSESRHWLLH